MPARTALRLFVLLAFTLCAQSPEVPDPRVAKLAPELREEGQALLQETDEIKRAVLVEDFVELYGVKSIDFLLVVLEKEASPRVRLEIIDSLGTLYSARVRQALGRLVSSDPDVNVGLRALDRLRTQQTWAMLQLLDQRLKLAREKGSAEDIRILIGEQERWLALSRGAVVPSFMLLPPPVFSVKPAGQPIRVLAFGDFGQDTPGQREAAAAMLQYHRQHRFDFAITLGDNFYPRGMASPSDPRWKTTYEELYAPLGVPFYASLGNHDWGMPDSPAAEVIYSQRSASWRMPATRYTFTAGAAQFFALDTQGMSQAQLDWLREELEKSTARWKIVYGHHPIYSHGAHGPTARLVEQLLPVLQNRADAFFAGHEHDMQHLKPEGGLHFFIAGSGGAGVRPIQSGPRSLFAASSHGFSVIEADATKLKVTFVDASVKPLYDYTLKK